MNNLINIIKNKIFPGIICVFPLYAFSSDINFTSYPDSISFMADQSGGVPSKESIPGNFAARVAFYGQNSTTDYSLYTYVQTNMPSCESNQPTLAWFNQHINSNPVLTYYSSTPSAYGQKWKYLSASASGTPVCGVQNSFSCRALDGTIWTQKYNACPNKGVNPPVIPEKPVESVCSLNSQNLNLSYSSTNLNVNGLTQSAYLNVSCTSGDAQNYSIKLTGSNVTNGRLNFGNGVSAQVSINGTQIQANGSGIQLSSLISRSIPVTATLVGTASASGITNANGILVLDAL